MRLAQQYTARALQKALKGQRITLFLVPTGSNWLTARLAIKLGREEHAKQLCVSAQANAAGNTGLGEPSDHNVGWKAHPAVAALVKMAWDIVTPDGEPMAPVYRCGHFYACKVEASIGLAGWSNSGAEALTLREVTNKVIRDKKLWEQYPECDLSRLLAALEALGAVIEVKK